MFRILLAVLLVPGSIAAEDSSFEARKARTRNLLEQCDYRAALAAAQSIHREWMDDVSTYQLMAEAHLGLGDYNAAESDIQWMLDLREGKADAHGWWLVAQFREATGDIEGAMEAVSAALARLQSGRDAESPKMLAYAGRLYAFQHRFDAAEKMAASALTASPSEAEARTVLARVRDAQGRREEAIAILRELVNTSHEPRYLYLLAQLTGDYRAFEVGARERIGTFRNANRELVLYLAGPGKKAVEALQIAGRESERRHDVATLGALATALAANGKIAEARLTIAKALAVGTRDPEILAQAARLGMRVE
jgi:tetratricopeptide (TPR) repeat protein